MSSPRVAIVILNWNGREDVLNCVSTLPRLTYPNFVATVVDNASVDGSVEALRERFPQQRVLVMEKNLGFCGGNNRAIADALTQGADYVLLCNNDTELSPDLVSELVRVACEDVKIGVVGAKNLQLEEPNRIWGSYSRLTYGRELIELVGRNELDTAGYRQVLDVDAVIGNGMMMSRSAIETIGGFDEQFFGYHEDVDWCVRVHERGFRVVHNGAAVIYHKGFGASDPGRPIPFPVLYFLGRNGVVFVRKHGSLRQSGSFVSAFLLDVLGRLGAALLHRQPLKPYLWMLRGFVDGLFGRLPLHSLKLQ